MIGLCGLCGSCGSRLNDTISCQTRSRSVPDVVVLNSPNPAGSLIKCQRLPRVCLDIVSFRRYFFG